MAAVARSLLTALLLASLSACGGGSAAGDGRVSVVASIYPWAFVAERIGGEHVRVTTLTQPGQEPHDLELSVTRTAEVSDADLVVYGTGFQPAVDEAVATSEPRAVVEAGSVLAGGARTPVGEARPIEGDPHVWLDPVALAAVAEEVEARLVELDPDHAAAFERNGSTLREELADLDGRYERGLADCERRTVVVSHDAFAYLGARYGLDFESVAGLSPEAEPSPEHLAELHDLVKDEGITTVFSETLASPELTDALADDLGVATEVLDPIEGLTDRTSTQDYLSLMQENLKAVEEANGC